MGWKGIPEEGRERQEEKQRIDAGLSWQEAGGLWCEEQEVRLCTKRKGSPEGGGAGVEMVVCWGSQNAAGVGPAETGGQASWETQLLTAVESLLMGTE